MCIAQYLRQILKKLIRKKQQIIQRSTTHPTIRLTFNFNPNHHIKVATDTASYGLRAVIMHRYSDKTEKVIAYAARLILANQYV